MVVVLCERLAIQHTDGWIVCSMDRELGVYLASPTGGCVSFRVDLYVNLFHPPVSCGLVHPNL